jgi:hypothetical protein
MIDSIIEEEELESALRQGNLGMMYYLLNKKDTEIMEAFKTY